MLFESFEAVYEDERVGEIVIVDDCSDEKIYDQVFTKSIDFGKIQLFRNRENNDCYKNKCISLMKSENDWCILFDSDNILDKSYLDYIYDIEQWDEKTIYTPFFARPYFDFRKFGGLLITKENVAEWIDEPMFETMLNAANFFVNSHEYIKVFDKNTNPVTSDSIYMMLRWLEAGNKIQVVEELKYFHRVHDGSHYKNNVGRTPNGFHESILNKLRNLK